MSEKTGAVVVGVDGSDGAINAARWAAAVAARFETSLHIVHAMPSIGHNLTDTAAAIRAAVMSYQRDYADDHSCAVPLMRCAAQQPNIDVTTDVDEHTRRRGVDPAGQNCAHDRRRQLGSHGRRCAVCGVDDPGRRDACRLSGRGVARTAHGADQPADRRWGGRNAFLGRRAGGCIRVRRPVRSEGRRGAVMVDTLAGLRRHQSFADGLGRAGSRRMDIS